MKSDDAPNPMGGFGSNPNMNMMNMMNMIRASMPPGMTAMAPVMAKISYEMTPEGMVLKLTPSMGGSLEMMEAAMNRMSLMLGMGMPVMMGGVGMPMIICRGK